MPEKPGRRMTLRELMTHAEKCSRDLTEHYRATFLIRLSEFRDLSRPIRRRSHYPTMLALQNALKKIAEANGEAQKLGDYLYEQLAEIREHARREQRNKV
jgi:hypothetical protein